MKKKLQVFVSSTYTDLKEERQAAVEAILKSGNIPAGMELFTSSNESQLNTIKKWIDDSDIYMLILGGRYGSIEPLSGNSYTEVEYDYATEINKPLFAVVISEDYLYKGKGSDCIEKDNVAKLAAFRKKVLSNISSFFSSPNDIKLAIHESITDLKEKYSFIGWIPGNSEGKNTHLYEENLKLQKRIAELEREETLSTSNFNIPDLAEMTESFSFTCPCQIQTTASAAYTYSKITFSFTWNDLFAAIAPSLLDNQEDVAANAALKALCKKTHPTINDLDISKSILQTIKIQFMANDLIDSSGYSWDLTDKGRKGLIMLKAIKKKAQ